MVEVFKTNITCETTAGTLIAELQQLFPFAAINFDLEDCDNILRVKGESIHPPHIIAHLAGRGYACEVLD